MASRQIFAADKWWQHHAVHPVTRKFHGMVSHVDPKQFFKLASLTTAAHRAPDYDPHLGGPPEFSVVTYLFIIYSDCSNLFILDRCKFKKESSEFTDLRHHGRPTEGRWREGIVKISHFFLDFASHPKSGQPKISFCCCPPTWSGQTLSKNFLWLNPFFRKIVAPPFRK